MSRSQAAIGAALAISLSAPALAATVTAPPLPPPYAGVYQPRGVDEIGLWHDRDEDERRLANSPVLIRDEPLNAYVKSVLCATVGSDRCAAARIYIVRSPVFNATMAPNGTMRVFTGLLLRARNEAELGAVLGHEFGHFERRHTLALFKARRSGSDLLSWAMVLSSMSGSYAARSGFNQLQVSVYGNLYRFNRDQEREADLLGLGYLNASKYRPQAAAELWRNFMGEADASAVARGLKKPRYDTIAFFASHPPEAERAAYLDTLASPEGRGRDDGAQSYRQALAPWLPQFLDDQVKLNDFGATDYIIASLAQGGWTAPLWNARGDLYRARGNPRDLVNAVLFYGSAIALDPSSAEAFRGLGLSLAKSGQMTSCQAALRKYLELKPDAADAGMIKLMAGGS